MIHTPSLTIVCKVQHSKGPYPPILDKLTFLALESFLAWSQYHKTYYSHFNAVAQKASVLVKLSKKTDSSKGTSLLHYGINYGPKKFYDTGPSWSNNCV